MKTRDEVFCERPSGRMEISKRSKSQIRREDLQQKEGRIEIKLPRPKREVVLDVCLYCGAEFKLTKHANCCPRCAVPF